MRIKLKTKIWFTVLAVVLMFSFFSLYYFPAQQEKYLLDNYNSEVQNLANINALGAAIVGVAMGVFMMSWNVPLLYYTVNGVNF